MKTSVSHGFKRNILGVASSLAFFFGSMLFLPQFAQYAVVGVWLFMAGSGLMFIDTLSAADRSST